jgi:AcrR family transcriptional regulator
MSTTKSPVLSTAEMRRPRVAAAALDTFSRGGFHGTTVADIAREAKISPAYVFKLFPGKESLFVAALEGCFDAILATLERGADGAADQSPAGVLDAMGSAYAELIADRRLLMLQVHAQSVADIPEVGAALRSGLARITTFAKDRSRGSDDDVQRFVAYGQLCHLLVSVGIDDLPEAWARLLSHGIRHPD